MSDDNPTEPGHEGHDPTQPYHPVADEPTITATPGVQAPPPSVPGDPLTVPSGVAPPPKRRPAAYAAVIIGLLGLVGGAIYFARSVSTTSSKGAKTPEAAVQGLFDALGNRDFVGVLQTLTPAEGDLLSGRIKTMATELSRLGILSKNFNLSNVSGLDLKFAGLKYQTEALGTGFSTVKVTAGTVTYKFDPNTSPIGDFVRSFLPSKTLTTSSGTSNVSGRDSFFVTQQVNGSWYVSLFYTAAEGARKSGNAPLPQFGAGIAAKGAGSPDAAVDSFLRSLTTLDLRRMIELTPPDEAAALHDYAPLFLARAEAGLSELRKHFTLDIRTLDLSSSGSGDETLVKIKKFAFKLSIPAIGLSVDSDGTCYSITGGPFGARGTPQRICGNKLGSTGLGALAKPNIGFVTVQRGGSWYVSPTRTTFDAIIGILKALKPSDLAQIKQLVSTFGGLAGG